MRYEKEVRQMQGVELQESALATLTEAAKILGLSPSAMSDLVYRGVLTRFVDTDEPNPTRATRVLRTELAAEVLRRRERAGDGRLRGRARARVR